MQKIVEKILTHNYLNRIKNAIIKVSYIYISFSMLILFVSTFNVMNEQWTVVAYHVFLIFLAIVFPITMVESESITHKLHHAFLISLFYGLFQDQLLMYPIFSLLYSPIQIKVELIIKNIKIKNLNAPQAVIDYLNQIVTLILMVIFTFILVKFGEIPVLVFSNLFIWIVGMISSYIGLVITIFLTLFFWYTGIHGVGVIGNILRPFWFYAILANGYAFIQGDNIPYIATETFLQWCVWIGGSGATLGLAFLIRYFAKSDYLKSIRKDVMSTSLYNINETMIFGLPVVGNKLFMVPFFLSPLVAATVSYLAMAMGYVNITSFVSPWILPAPIGIFISTGFDFRSLLLFLVIGVITTLVYLPFFIIYDQNMK